jgi:hypothetical protein
MQLTVEAPTTNSRIYDVWYRTNLLQGAGWLPMGLNITGAQNGASINLTVTNVPGERHYRTGVRLPQ